MDEGFKHITVSPEPEEDVVIHAGLGAQRFSEGADEAQAEKPDEVKVPVESMPASEPTAAAKAASAEPPASASRAPKSAPSAKAESSDDDRLTREDLDAGPMPLAQRIVIAAVVVCLIGAIACYLLFMR